MWPALLVLDPKASPFCFGNDCLAASVSCSIHSLSSGDVSPFHLSTPGATSQALKEMDEWEDDVSSVVQVCGVWGVRGVRAGGGGGGSPNART